MLRNLIKNTQQYSRSQDWRTYVMKLQELVGIFTISILIAFDQSLPKRFGFMFNNSTLCCFASLSRALARHQRRSLLFPSIVQSLILF